MPNALEQVRVAAGTLCGQKSPHAAIPWFWSDQYGAKLKSVGLAEGHDQAVLRGEMTSGAFSVFYLLGGIVIAADCVNKVADFAQARKLVGARLPAEPLTLADETRPLKQFVDSAERQSVNGGSATAHSVEVAT